VTAQKAYKYKSRVVANWDRIPKVEGRVVEKGSVKIENKDRAYLLVNTDEGEVQVFHSAGLDDLFTASSLGDFVSIEFLAMVTTKKDRRFRQFRASCWTEEDAPPVVAVSGRGRGVSRVKKGRS
jgi:hypothetical protein